MHSYDLKKAPVTILLAAANILVFFILSASGSTENSYFMYEHGAMLTEAIRRDGEIWRMFTCLFLHFGFMHLANNMLSLFIFGALMENGIGHLRVLLIYFAAGLGGNVVSYLWDLHRGENTLSAGASGAAENATTPLPNCNASVALQYGMKGFWTLETTTAPGTNSLTTRSLSSM